MFRVIELIRDCDGLCAEISQFILYSMAYAKPTICERVNSWSLDNFCWLVEGNTSGKGKESNIKQGLAQNLI